MAISKHDCPISFRAPKELVERLDGCAEKLCLDRSSLLKMIIKIWLERFEGNEQEMYSNIYPRHTSYMDTSMAETIKKVADEISAYDKDSDSGKNTGLKKSV